MKMMYRSQPTLQFFSAAVKNIASPNLEIKKLVYIFLLCHAEAEPDTALLSINTIQRSLTDSNPQLRALALRVMSGIRVPVISQIVLLGIKRGVGDMSPLVRKAAALAIPKCFRLDPNNAQQLTEYLSLLLGDRQYYVAGAAVAAFLDMCPERIDLIHPHYRSLNRKVVDMDEWGQLATIKILTVYCRKCFTQPPQSVHDDFENKKTTLSGNSQDLESESKSLDPDLALFAHSLKPLLQSRSSAVILAVTRASYYLQFHLLKQAVASLVTLMRGPPSIVQIALHDMVHIALTHAHLFTPFYNRFLLRGSEPSYICPLKLEMLSLIFPHAPKRLQSILLSDLVHSSQCSSTDPARATASVRAIGRCATNAATDPQTRGHCLNLLLQHTCSSDPRLAADALDVIRLLIQRDPRVHKDTIIRLAKHLDAATSSHARACIVWLVGEYDSDSGDPCQGIAADVLRILLRKFSSESEAAKLQIVLLAARVYLRFLESKKNENTSDAKTEEQTAESKADETRHLDSTNGFAGDESKKDILQEQHPIEKLWTHTLLLARYDTSFDLRDRMRTYRALLSAPESTALASLLLLAPKSAPSARTPSDKSRDFNLGTTSLLVGEDSGQSGLRGYESLPNWAKAGEANNSHLRNSADDTTSASSKEPWQGTTATEFDKSGSNEKGGVGVSGKAVGEKTLDDWLAESDQDDVRDDESEETTDEEDEYEESEEEETDETDDDEDDEAESEDELLENQDHGES